jgi:ribose-phosphate pyrophosphokinase
MQVLNLDPNFKLTEDIVKTQPLLPFSEIQFKQFNFPSGCEPHIKLDPDTVLAGHPAVIACRINSMNDMMVVLLATDALKRLGVNHIELFIPFMPFARQDRVCDKGEPFSIKVLADIINMQGYKQVIMVDAHSDVAPALINNSVVISNATFVAAVMYGYEVIMDEYNPAIIASDGGAAKKIYKTLKEIELYDVEDIECSKVRDLKTGKITTYKVHTEKPLTNRTCYIIDDICDGGATYKLLVKRLKELGAARVVLLITFGIFSNGLDTLFEAGIDKIYTTTLFNDIAPMEYINSDKYIGPEYFQQLKLTDI